MSFALGEWLTIIPHPWAVLLLVTLPFFLRRRPVIEVASLAIWKRLAPSRIPPSRWVEILFVVALTVGASGVHRLRIPRTTWTSDGGLVAHAAVTVSKGRVNREGSSTGSFEDVDLRPVDRQRGRVGLVVFNDGNGTLDENASRPVEISFEHGPTEVVQIEPNTLSVHFHDFDMSHRSRRSIDVEVDGQRRSIPVPQQSGPPRVLNRTQSEAIDLALQALRQSGVVELVESDRDAPSVVIDDRITAPSVTPVILLPGTEAQSRGIVPEIERSTTPDGLVYGLAPEDWNLLESTEPRRAGQSILRSTDGDPIIVEGSQHLEFCFRPDRATLSRSPVWPVLLGRAIETLAPSPRSIRVDERRDAQWAWAIALVLAIFLGGSVRRRLLVALLILLGLASSGESRDSSAPTPSASPSTVGGSTVPSSTVPLSAVPLSAVPKDAVEWTKFFVDTKPGETVHWRPAAPPPLGLGSYLALASRRGIGIELRFPAGLVELDPPTPIAGQSVSFNWRAADPPSQAEQAPTRWVATGPGARVVDVSPNVENASGGSFVPSVVGRWRISSIPATPAESAIEFDMDVDQPLRIGVVGNDRQLLSGRATRRVLLNRSDLDRQLQSTDSSEDDIDVIAWFANVDRTTEASFEDIDARRLVDWIERGGTLLVPSYPFANSSRLHATIVDLCPTPYPSRRPKRALDFGTVLVDCSRSMAPLFDDVARSVLALDARTPERGSWSVIAFDDQAEFWSRDGQDLGGIAARLESAGASGGTRIDRAIALLLESSPRPGSSAVILTDGALPPLDPTVWTDLAVGLDEAKLETIFIVVDRSGSRGERIAEAFRAANPEVIATKPESIVETVSQLPATQDPDVWAAVSPPLSTTGPTVRPRTGPAPSRRVLESETTPTNDLEDRPLIVDARGAVLLASRPVGRGRVIGWASGFDAESLPTPTAARRVGRMVARTVADHLRRSPRPIPRVESRLGPEQRTWARVSMPLDDATLLRRSPGSEEIRRIPLAHWCFEETSSSSRRSRQWTHLRALDGSDSNGETRIVGRRNDRPRPDEGTRRFELLPETDFEDRRPQFERSTIEGSAENPPVQPSPIDLPSEPLTQTWQRSLRTLPPASKPPFDPAPLLAIGALVVALFLSRRTA